MFDQLVADILVPNFVSDLVLHSIVDGAVLHLVQFGGLLNKCLILLHGEVFSVNFAYLHLAYVPCGFNGLEEVSGDESEQAKSDCENQPGSFASDFL